MINEARQRWKYIISDLVSTTVAVLAFYAARFYMFDSIRMSHRDSLSSFMLSKGSQAGILTLIAVMMATYYIAGNYDTVILRSRLRELTSTLICAAVGTLVFFFTALLNDVAPERITNYEILGLLLCLLFVCVYIPRYLLTRHTSRMIQSGLWANDTLVVGTGTKAREIAANLSGRYRQMAMRVVGFVAVPGSETPAEIDSLPVYAFDDLADVVSRLGIKQLIIEPHDDSKQTTVELINRLFPLDLPMYITPDMYQLMTARLRLSNVVGMPLIDISRTEMPMSTLNIKRLSDIVLSAMALIVTAPLMAVIAVAIKRGSKGPVFYRQERVGYHKKKFNILKFRTMTIDAEENGPALSSENDPRITGVGRTLRRYRLDELPNFWNVLKGDMSIVGPRPEREHFIKQIIERAPHYTLVHQVRPGITSLGMVQYGYANTVDGMIERMRYDLIYLENVSFLVDIKILIYTVNTVIGGKGM